MRPAPYSPDDARTTLDLSLPQVVGGSVAAATAAALSTRLGLVGTIAGAAFASVVSAFVTAAVTSWVAHARDLVVVREPTRWRRLVVLAVGVALVATAFHTGLGLLTQDLPGDTVAARWLRELGVTG